MLATSKVCAECRLEKPASDFYVVDGGRYLSGPCKPCTAVRVARFRAEKRAEHGFDAYHVMRTYGVTVEQYREMLARQGGVCAVCQREPDDAARSLCVDHDHETGAVRGLLCRPCNAAIGLLEEDPDRLRAALAYLEGEMI